MPSALLNVLRNAGQYFHTHAGATLILSLDASCFTQSEARFRQLFDDLALLCSLNIKFIIVFSPEPVGAPQCIPTEAALAECLDRIARVKILLERLASQSFYKYMRATSVVSGNFISAKPFGIIEGVDYGYYGRVRGVESSSLSLLHQSHPVIFVAPIGFSPNGETFVLDGIEVATAIARSIKAHKLMVLGTFDYGFPREMTLFEANSLLQTAKGQGLSTTAACYLNAAVSILDRVDRVHFLEVGTSGSLLLELLTRDGVGTMITDQQYDLLRVATAQDVPLLAALIEPFEREGILVCRSTPELERDIHHFSLMFRDGALIGCVAFYPYLAEKMGELACLVIHPDYRHGKKANILLSYVEELARSAGVERLFLLTTQTAHWFIDNGFILVDKAQLPAAKRDTYDPTRNSKILVKSLD